MSPVISAVSIGVRYFTALEREPWGLLTSLIRFFSA